MSDDELRTKINTGTSSMYGMGEYKAYLDEARRRGIVK